VNEKANRESFGTRNNRSRHYCQEFLTISSNTTANRYPAARIYQKRRRILDPRGAYTFQKNIFESLTRHRALEQVPEELVVHLVVILHFLRLDESAQCARAAVGGRALQIGIAVFHIGAD
jgi:hypothetical protein